MKHHRFLTFVLILSSWTAFSQETTISPYSRLSIGNIQGATFARNFAMGGLTNALTDPGNMNPYNPASFTEIAWTSFEVGVIGDNIWLKSGNQTQNANTISFNHLGLGFPVTRWWGMGLGIMPLSKIGYSYKTAHTLVSDHNNIEYQNIFDGSGGLNQVYLSNGFKFMKKLSLGFNFAYYFGKMEYQEVQEFVNDNNINNSAWVNRTEAGGAHLDFGAQLPLKLTGKWDMMLGATFVPIQGINANSNDLEFTYSGTSGVPRVIDTTSFIDNASFSIILPPKFGFGVLFSNTKTVKVGFDVDYTRWSLSNYNTYGGFEDVYMIKGGSEFVLGDHRYKIRLGARYGTVPIVLNGENPVEMAGTFGIAIPFRTKDKLALTEMNIGVEIGQRGKNEGLMIEERFINIHVGINLSNKWFIKRVYD